MNYKHLKHHKTNYFPYISLPYWSIVLCFDRIHILAFFWWNQRETLKPFRLGAILLRVSYWHYSESPTSTRSASSRVWFIPHYSPLTGKQIKSETKTIYKQNEHTRNREVGVNLLLPWPNHGHLISWLLQRWPLITAFLFTLTTSTTHIQ